LVLVSISTVVNTRLLSALPSLSENLHPAQTCPFSSQFLACLFTLVFELFRSRNRAGQPRSKRSPTPTGTLARKNSTGSEPPSPGGQLGPKPLYLSRPFADAALVKGNFKTIVMQPKYVDVNEWVAVNSEQRRTILRCFSYANNASFVRCE
jgi:hypothetical protein